MQHFYIAFCMLSTQELDYYGQRVIMSSQRFVVGINHDLLLLVGVFVDPAFFEDILDLLVQDLVNAFEIIADHLRPDEISSDSFGSPFDRCLDKQSSIVADFISNLDEFSVVVSCQCFLDLCFLPLGWCKCFVVSASNNQILDSCSEFFLKLLNCGLGVFNSIMQGCCGQDLKILDTGKRQNMDDFERMIDVRYVSLLFPSLGLVFFSGEDEGFGE